MEFLIKAQRALKNGDETLAKEALQLKRAQTEASHDVILHVDEETQLTNSLNKSLMDFQYIKEPHKSTLLEPPLSIPKTAALKFSYLPSGPAPVVDSWTDAFSKEIKNYGSFAVYAESKLQEAIHHGFQNQGGNHSKVDPGIPAVCLDLMLKMGNSAFGFRFAPLIRLLSTQLIRCIYIVNGDPSTTISEEDLDKASIRWLSSQKPWFLSNEEALKERDALKRRLKTESAGKDMKKLLDSRNAGIKLLFDKHQKWMRKIIFSTWRGWCTTEKAKKNKFRRYQQYKWLRRWKNYVFAGTGGDSDISGGQTALNSEERSWQKRFRAQEKEKQRMQEQIENLKEQLQHNQHELGVAYEIISDLQPHLSIDFIGQQNAAEKRKSAMRDIGEEKKRAAAGKQIRRTSNIGLDILHWKNKVKERMADKRLQNADLAVFARNKVVHHSMKCQTDISGSIIPENKRRHKRSLTNKAKKAAASPLIVGDIINIETRAPKMSPASITHAISLLLEILCKKYHSVSVKSLPHPRVPELIRDLLIKKYGVHALALKYLTSLCASSQKDESSDALFKIFNELTSINTSGTRMFKPEHLKFDVFLLVSFLRRLCPGGDYASLTRCLCDDDGRSWDRSAVCSSIHKSFPNICIKNPDLYKDMLAKVAALPVTTVKGKEKEPRVPLDEAIVVVMEYVEEERYARAQKPSKALVQASIKKIRPAMLKFIFSHHSKRRKAMEKSMELFKEWDAKLHKHGQVFDGEGVISGALRLQEFGELIRARTTFEPSEAEVLRMFLEWHELIEADKKVLDFTGKKVGDDLALMNLDKSMENIGVLVEGAEKEIQEADELLERKAKLQKEGMRQEMAVAAMEGGAGASILIPRAPLPKRAHLPDRNRLLYTKMQQRFMESQFSETDGVTAQTLESRMGGYKFGEAAFAKLCWNYRIE
ncbi:hypothetical protein TrCOL_g78 [Triparma columacea]|nr:hypothetical protein TrCOL_g78 [Triparma columacea]